MRDEDLKNLPQSISREKMFAALALLGFGPEQWRDISHIGIGPQSATITAWWVDENGRRMSREVSDTQLAVPEFTVTIPLVGEKTCGTQFRRRGRVAEECTLPPGHVGEHVGADRPCPSRAPSELSAARRPCKFPDGHSGQHKVTVAGVPLRW